METHAEVILPRYSCKKRNITRNLSKGIVEVSPTLFPPLNVSRCSKQDLDVKIDDSQRLEVRLSFSPGRALLSTTALPGSSIEYCRK